MENCKDFPKTTLFIVYKEIAIDCKAESLFHNAIYAHDYMPVGLGALLLN